MAIEIISIVGKSDSGKTTLIEKLIPALERRGIRVATVKHDVHKFDIDHPGKDTYRHFAAGARSVLISSPAKLALVKRLDGPVPLDELVDRYIDDADIIITEGYKSGDKPKIEVFRPETHKEPLCGPGEGRVAIVTDADIDVDCPRFGLEDIDTIAEFIIDNFIKK